MGSSSKHEHRRVGSVGRDPVTLRFVANWSDEADNNEDGGEFESIDDAIAWARERAPKVIVVLGFTRPLIFSAGEVYEPGEEPDRDPLPQWPPSAELLSELLADTDIPRSDWGAVEILGVEERDDRKGR